MLIQVYQFNNSYTPHPPPHRYKYTTVATQWWQSSLEESCCVQSSVRLITLFYQEKHLHFYDVIIACRQQTGKFYTMLLATWDYRSTLCVFRLFKSHSDWWDSTGTCSYSFTWGGDNSIEPWLWLLWHISSAARTRPAQHIYHEDFTRDTVLLCINLLGMMCNQK